MEVIGLETVYDLKYIIREILLGTVIDYEDTEEIIEQNVEEIYGGIKLQANIESSSEEEEIDIDLFKSLLDEIKERSEKGYQIYLSSLIVDAYEMLKWFISVGDIQNEELNLLKQLEIVSSFEEAEKVILSEENVELFIQTIEWYHTLPESDLIGSKNNIENVSVNKVIVEGDKLRFWGLVEFYFNNVIFSKDYKKEEYIKLHDFLYQKYSGDKRSVESAYLCVINDVSYYNKVNFNKLILDMCKEFYFQMKHNNQKNTNNLDENSPNYNDQYLLRFICERSYQHIIEEINFAVPLLNRLVQSYCDYNYYDSQEREKFDKADYPKSKIKVWRKLNKGIQEQK